MPYWLKHAEHGQMPVYNTGDVERHKQWGWVLLNEGNEPAKEAAPKPDPMDEGAYLERRRVGRPRKA